MTDREKVIKALTTCSKTGWCEGNNDCPYFVSEKEWHFDDCKQVLKDALELLKEQEPVKPIYNEQKYGDHLPHCGNCEKALPNKAVYGKVNFCHYCGKAVRQE